MIDIHFLPLIVHLEFIEHNKEILMRTGVFGVFDAAIDINAIVIDHSSNVTLLFYQY